MYLIFDTETTGLPSRYDAPITDTNNWPRCVQIAWQLHDDMGKLVEHKDYLIQPDGFDIPFDSEKIHGISTLLAETQGSKIVDVLKEFNEVLNRSKFVVGHNVGFDINIMGAEMVRYNVDTQILTDLPVLDTCTETTANVLQIPGGRGGRFKLPTLTELHEYLFGEKFAEAHNATADVEATTRCFLELIRRRIFTTESLDVTPEYFEKYSKENPQPIHYIGLKHINLKEASAKLKAERNPSGVDPRLVVDASTNEEFSQSSFVHLHTHTQFSVLQSTISIGKLIQTAAKFNMPAVTMTDIGNMMGAFQFVKAVSAYNKDLEGKRKVAEENGEEFTQKPIKAIIGCQFNICENRLDKSRKDNGYLVVFIAKNKKGYQNLVKMASIGYTEGYYYVPRIDREIVEKYKEDLIVLTGNLFGEVPHKILNLGEKQAEEALLWWKQNFNDNLYIELMRHHQDDENHVNETLLKFSRTHNIPVVATNNVYYTTKEEANAHDILLCVRDGEKQETPIGRGRGFRYGLPNHEYYFKSAEEMKSLFKDIPEAIVNTVNIANLVESYGLARDVLLPKFDIPEEFQVAEDELDGGKRGENKYLTHLTFKGAEKRYGTITPSIRERLDFELATIERTGYPGYFLIVQDFIAAARNMGVSVGPGRGSAAGSAVAYCLGITNIDPIKYDLLFERFLNPDRVSMPDIDIDFDDEGRASVMDYVIEKYGANQVAQIITYGKMATKSALKDTARVLDLPLQDSDRLSKLIPNMMPSKWNIARFLVEDKENIKKALKSSEEFDRINELIQLSNEGGLISETIHQAKVLEGSLRNTGVHACGVIITPDDITNYVPISTAKDSDMAVTQFDNSVAEEAGLLKMDFLGLKTLTLIKDTCKLVKYKTGIELNPDEFPIDDPKTYELFQRGETVGIFQYESAGMQKYMKELRPTVFADLIAMNALYRPGPLEYIPSFIRRKNGKEPITFDLDACEEYLGETYGITVYQEQVMLLSQKLADFTKGDADVLRKAMGKKQKDVLDKMKSKFITQAVAKGHDEKKLDKIWTDWEAFASYAFNKSHSTCYAWVAYQTAYLKAHYPAEFMAAVLSNNMNDIKQVTFFMEECRRMGIQVLGPDVNESFYKFTVNDKNQIRFGMGAIKGVGAGAVNTIIENRSEGLYKSIFDLAKRIDLKAANKKAFENLALAGGFDCFENINRAQYFQVGPDNQIFLEKVIKFGSRFKENENSSQVSLFGESIDVEISEPTIPFAEEWNTMEKLAKEKNVVGIYISGHPLDDYKHEMKYFCQSSMNILHEPEKLIGKAVSFGGIITNVNHAVAKNGNGYGSFDLEGYDESFTFFLFGDDYMKFRHMLALNCFVFLRVSAKEGYVNKTTGKKSDPKIEVREIKLLSDVLSSMSKKITLQLEISETTEHMIMELKEVIQQFDGPNTLHLELIESDIVKKLVVDKTAIDFEDTEEISEVSAVEDENIPVEMIEIEEKIQRSKINLVSRKFKVNICKELLDELERLNINIRLN